MVKVGKKKIRYRTVVLAIYFTLINLVATSTSNNRLCVVSNYLFPLEGSLEKSLILSLLGKVQGDLRRVWPENNMKFKAFRDHFELSRDGTM